MASSRFIALAVVLISLSMTACERGLLVLLDLRAFRDRRVLWGHRDLRVRLVLQGQRGKLDCRAQQGRKE